MTAFIVEDMPEALAALTSDLHRVAPDLEIIGTAAGVIDAAKQLRSLKPDLLFLDIMLGDGTGFDILELIPDLDAQIIFITASDEFAVRAFRFAAVDYLLKPVDQEALREALQRARTRHGISSADSLELLRNTIRQPEVLPDRISLHTSEKILVAPVREVIRCEADGNNTRFFFTEERPVFVTKTLKHYQGMLEGHHFIRVHQSHLVNLRHVVEFKKVDSGYLRMTNGDEVPVASRKRAEVIDLLR
ncbi:LytTR family DNA-binding domain-containing protein [Lewinella sp. W8]|uniref:LytR/AlgR family response regulator transcription factor n=1 Tax=Lewinella sp. W8 TaxID=2528208 RepID=UPI001068303D|nr:LytTR family DNA-binding domain-containing protein [Lewinella sp. W8]MTB49368.1 response regulator [Lewinella sp. W8]